VILYLGHMAGHLHGAVVGTKNTDIECKRDRAWRMLPGNLTPAIRWRRDSQSDATPCTLQPLIKGEHVKFLFFLDTQELI